MTRSMTSSPRPLITARRSQRLKPLTCSAPIVGGMDSSCGAVTTSRTAGPSCASTSATAPGEIAGVFDPYRVDAHGAGHGGEIGVLKVRAQLDEAGRLHLQRHEAENAIVEDHGLDRKILLLERDRSPISMVKPPSPDSEITCRSGCAAWMPMACGIALAMEPCTSERPAGAAVHLQIARRQIVGVRHRR